MIYTLVLLSLYMLNSVWMNRWITSQRSKAVVHNLVDNTVEKHHRQVEKARETVDNLKKDLQVEGKIT